MSQPVENMALAGWLQDASPNITRAWQGGDFNISYGPGALISESIYLDRASIGEDREMGEHWKGDAYQMLLLSRLYSAKVATLLALSVPNILQNQVNSAFYLAHIYQQLSAQQYGSQALIASSLSNLTGPPSEKRYLKKTSNRTPKRQHTNKNVVAQPAALGVKMPLEIFFSQYSKFQYQLVSSPVDEFNRLREGYGWKKGDREMEAARHDFDLAMKKEFDSLYGSDEKDIRNWYKLCHVLRIDPVPNTLKECRAAVCRKHVNLVDLVGGSRENTRIFKSEKELSEYTIETGKFFPKKDAADGGVLRAPRRQIWAPQDDY